ncbi:MAG: GIY-YIG nuclease family protein, partial [Bacteroidetes bacterium]|nr:GIY-YIG nuclease family protein [Bacteroidota bacterium]
MFTVYAIKSTSRNFICVGFTNNLHRRFYDHTNGYIKTTKP